MCHRTVQILPFGCRSYSEYVITINRPDPEFLEFLILSDASKVSVSSTPKVNNLPKSRSVRTSDNISKIECHKGPSNRKLFGNHPYTASYSPGYSSVFGVRKPEHVEPLRTQSPEDWLAGG